MFRHEFAVKHNTHLHNSNFPAVNDKGYNIKVKGNGDSFGSNRFPIDMFSFIHLRLVIHFKRLNGFEMNHPVSFKKELYN